MYDLEVPKSFIPKSKDGEVENFKLMSPERILFLIRNTNKIKNNCSLVFISFLIRHGLINPENEKDYEIITSSLSLNNLH